VFWVSTLCDTADIQLIIHFHPYPLQHVTIDFEMAGMILSQLRHVLWQVCTNRVQSVSLLENLTWHQIRQTWWPVRLCWLLCCCVSNPELGQMLIEVALDEVVVVMWWSLIVLGGEVIIVVDNLWH